MNFRIAVTFTAIDTLACLTAEVPFRDSPASLSIKLPKILG